jgi:hypothetical protein
MDERPSSVIVPESPWIQAPWPLWPVVPMDERPFSAIVPESPRIRAP